MYQLHRYSHIVLAIFTQEVTLHDVTQFAHDVSAIAESETELFLIAIPINMLRYPFNLPQLFQALQPLRPVLSSFECFYGVRTSPIISFMSRILTGILGITSNTTEAKSLEVLFSILQADTTQYPALQASIHHLDQIKADIAQIQAQ